MIFLEDTVPKGALSRPLLSDNSVGRLSLRFGWDGFFGTDQPLEHWGIFRVSDLRKTSSETVYSLLHSWEFGSKRSLEKAARHPSGWMAVSGLEYFDRSLPKAELICKRFSIRPVESSRAIFNFAFTTSKLDNLRR